MEMVFSSLFYNFSFIYDFDTAVIASNHDPFVKQSWSFINKRLEEAREATTKKVASMV